MSNFLIQLSNALRAKARAINLRAHNPRSEEQGNNKSASSSNNFKHHPSLAFNQICDPKQPGYNHRTPLFPSDPQIISQIPKSVI